MKKGFTLIELLAVIVILAVISLIAMPMIMDIINKSRENVIKASAQNYAHAVEVEAFNLQTNNLVDISDGTFSTTELDDYVTYSGPEVKGTVTLKDGMVTGYDLYINGYRVKKDGDEVIAELSDEQVHNGVNEIDVVRGDEVVHITDSSELQDGDVYVNGQFEYHYNAIFSLRDFEYLEVNNDSTLNGWSMTLTPEARYNDEEINTEMMIKIMGKDIVSMVGAFYDCAAKTINLSSFDTSNVTSMEFMFYSCSYLTGLDLSGFNTPMVTDMRYMFASCSSLTNLNLSGFDTSNVTNMSGMFHFCSNLTSLDLSGFVTSKVTDMSFMFGGCSSLISLDLIGLDTSKVTDMTSMFYSCSNLTYIYVDRSWSTDAVVYSSGMFTGCSKLPNFNSSVEDKTNAHADTGGYLNFPVG